MQRIFGWLKDEANRDIVKMGAAAFAAVVGALWIIWIYTNRPQGGVTVYATHGSMAAGRDIVTPGPGR